MDLGQLIKIKVTMAIIAEKTLIIESPNDLDAEIHRYDCQTKEELEDVLWNDYGVTLVTAYGQDIY